VGDSLKIGSWILAYLLLARGKILALSVLEFVGSGVFLGGYYAFAEDGVEAATKAYALNYAIYWVLTAAACWYYFVHRDEWATGPKSEIPGDLTP
jgi:PST family polysaccharide transporter